VRRLVPPILFAICLGLMALLRWRWPVAILFPRSWSFLGAIAVLVGLLVGFAGLVQFRRANTNILPFREADTLVTTGPFRYTRNPMYLGLALVLLGAWVLMGALSPIVGVAIFVVAADRWYIRFEERMLQQKFAADFTAYRSKVRRWL
jgi:protein-S-isoprenylcysteine O-methyltransferase Ste14